MNLSPAVKNLIRINLQFFAAVCFLASFAVGILAFIDFGGGWWTAETAFAEKLSTSLMVTVMFGGLLCMFMFLLSFSFQLVLIYFRRGKAKNNSNLFGFVMIAGFMFLYLGSISIVNFAGMIFLTLAVF